MATSVGGGGNTPQENLKKVVEEINDVKDQLGSIIDEITDSLASGLQDFSTILQRDITKRLRESLKLTDDLIKNESKFIEGLLERKDIEKQIFESRSKQLITSDFLLKAFISQNAQLGSLITNAESFKQIQDAILNGSLTLSQEQKDYVDNQVRLNEINENYLKYLDQQLIKVKEIDKKLGATGKLIKGISKIPLIGNIIDAKEAQKQMRKAIQEPGGTQFKALKAGLTSISTDIKDFLKDPITLITFFIKQALKANEQAVDLGKALGTSGTGFRETLANIEIANSNINVTTESLTKAFGQLVQSTGFAYKFTEDQLVTQIKLTEQIGLQADEAAQVQRLGVLNNKTSEETYRSFVKGLVATRNQLKVGIDFKSALAEATKVSGQLAANLGYSPERIAEAIVQAKAFGMTLDQVNKSGDYLLNWESSIESELKAELITGKQINLERARAAALVGDQVTLTEELAKNIGTSVEFTKMNRIAQKSLAESVGLTTDELAESLRKREEAIRSGKSLAQITEEEAASALERQSAQAKFNKLVEKLISITGNFVAGPLGVFLDVLSDILSVVTKIVAGMQEIFGSTISRTVVGALGGAAIGNLPGAIIGGLGGLIGGLMADDMVSSGYGSRKLVTPTQTIALNNNDTVIAGTNLVKGDDTLSMPKGSLNLNNNADLSPIINAINEVKSAINTLASRPSISYIQGEDAFAKSIGTTQVQNSYRLA
jgi:hypothetical protein